MSAATYAARRLVLRLLPRQLSNLNINIARPKMAQTE